MSQIQVLYSFLRFLVVIAIIIIGGLLTFYISTVTYPFIIAFIIALIINPLVTLLEKKVKMPRALAVFLTMVLMIAVMAGIITLLVAEIISGSTYLSRVVPEHFQQLILYVENFIAHQVVPFYNDMFSYFRNLDSGQQATILNNIQSVGERIASTISQALERILKSIPNMLALFPNLATIFVFSLLATFFISKDWLKLRTYSEKFLPTKVRTSTQFVFTDLKLALVGFIKAQLTLVSITAVIVLIGLIILKIKYALTIAIIIGFVDLLPYLGTGLVFVPWIAYSFFTEEVTLGIGLSILYIVVIVVRQVMEPKILSTSIGLDPLATLVALFVGFKILGFLGLIVGPVILVVMKTLHHANIFRDIWGFIIGKNNNA